MDSNSDYQCVICLDSSSALEQVDSTCQHTFHKTCLSDWFVISGEHKCPLCRSEWHAWQQVIPPPVPAPHPFPLLAKLTVVQWLVIQGITVLGLCIPLPMGHHTCADMTPYPCTDMSILLLIFLAISTLAGLLCWGIKWHGDVFEIITFSWVFVYCVFAIVGITALFEENVAHKFCHGGGYIRPTCHEVVWSSLPHRIILCSYSAVLVCELCVLLRVVF